MCFWLGFADKDCIVPENSSPPSIMVSTEPKTDMYVPVNVHSGS